MKKSKSVYDVCINKSKCTKDRLCVKRHNCIKPDMLTKEQIEHDILDEYTSREDKIFNYYEERERFYNLKDKG